MACICFGWHVRSGRATESGLMPAVLFCLMLLLARLAGCASEPPRTPMATWAPSPNHEPRRAVLIVLHATEQESVEESLATLQSGNSSGPVSSHYLIGRDGAIYQLVSDERRAWHAGGGRWGTIT